MHVLALLAQAVTPYVKVSLVFGGHGRVSDLAFGSSIASRSGMRRGRHGGLRPQLLEVLWHIHNSALPRRGRAHARAGLACVVMHGMPCWPVALTLVAEPYLAAG